MVSVMLAIEGRVFRGPQGIRRYFAILDESWDEFLIHPNRFREVPNLVFVLGRLSGCGRTSGVTVDSEVGIVINIRDGKIARLRGFLDQGAALEAAGLAE
jgi:ketosteroid isomerase-like protein